MAETGERDTTSQIETALASYAPRIEYGDDVVIRLGVDRHGNIRTRIADWPHKNGKCYANKLWDELSDRDGFLRWQFNGAVVSNTD